MTGFLSGLLSGLTGLVSVDNPVGLLAILSLAMSADAGFAIPAVIEPALFLTTYHAGPLSPSVIGFVAMLAVGRQVGTAFLYWLSWFTGNRFIEWLCKRFPLVGRGLASRKCQFEGVTGMRLFFAIATARLMPGFLQVSSITAGTLRVRYAIVAAAAVLSGIIYDGIIVALGYLSKIWLRDLRPEYSTWIVIGLVLLIILTSTMVGWITGRKSRDTRV